MSQTTTAGNIDLRDDGGRAPHALREWLGEAADVLRGFLSMRRATPEEIAACDVQAVRAMADSVRDTDPGFASDLYAAACRHECAIEEAAGQAC